MCPLYQAIGTKYPNRLHRIEQITIPKNKIAFGRANVHQWHFTLNQALKIELWYIRIGRKKMSSPQ